MGDRFYRRMRTYARTPCPPSAAILYVQAHALLRAISPVRERRFMMFYRQEYHIHIMLGSSAPDILLIPRRRNKS